jgi:GAF domain-containing protein
MGAVTSFDGEQIQLMAHHGVPLEEEQATRALFPMSPGLGMMLARAIADHAPAQSTDVSNDPEHVSREASPRNVLAVPMITGATCIGSIAVSRSEPGLFSDKQVKLLQTFADQEVIAIENARLFAEIEAALGQQTVTAEILQVISDSPSDVQPVFQAIADRAMTMCKALSA